MTKQSKALQMAINALTNCSKFEEAIQACKDALELPSWQGLSDDELDALNGSPMVLEHSGLYKFARAIEQALKEKNNGSDVG